MIEFDNNFFFSKKGLDFNNNKIFKLELDNAIKASEDIFEESSFGNNEILESFKSTYQQKLRKIKKTIDFKKKKKIIIGLGGSSSGAKALSFFMKDEITYFDNLDYDYFKNFFTSNNIQDFVFFIISKSGNTFETLALLNLLILESKNIKYEGFDIFKEMVIITEDTDSILKNFSKKNNIKFIQHNPKIGGRFSILSESGMLPFIDNDIVVENASEKFIEMLKDSKHEMSPAKNTAIILTCIKEMKLNIYCNLLYNYRLKHFSYWLHQLHAESLGKNNFGMTPITSICPKDHHSMMQLYLDGPKDKFFNIYSPPDEIHYEEFLKENFYNIENYTPFGLLEKQFKSVREVFFEKQIPHRVIFLKDHKNPLNLIELFSYFLLETILIGKIIGINPYDQPAVELVKKKIFKD